MDLRMLIRNRFILLYNMLGWNIIEIEGIEVGPKEPTWIGL